MVAHQLSRGAGPTPKSVEPLLTNVIERKMNRITGGRALQCGELSALIDGDYHRGREWLCLSTHD